MKLNDLKRSRWSDPEFRDAYLEEDLVHRVSERVFHFRKLLGLTQSDLAQALGTKQPAIAEIEGGYKNISLRRLARLAIALKCTPVQLVTPSFVGIDETLFTEDKVTGRDGAPKTTLHLIVEAGKEGISSHDLVAKAKLKSAKSLPFIHLAIKRKIAARAGDSVKGYIWNERHNRETFWYANPIKLKEIGLL